MAWAFSVLKKMYFSKKKPGEEGGRGGEENRRQTPSIPLPESE